MSLFAEAFGSFLQSGAFYDVVLKTGTKTYQAHKILLSFSSGFFQRLFNAEQNWKELETTVVRLKFPDPANVFPLILQFIYEGELELKEEFVVPLAAQADYYCIEHLSAQCHDFIKHHLNKHQNVMKVLADAIKYHQHNLIDKCLKLVAANFLHMHNEDYSLMSYDLFLRLLNHDRLAVKDEWLLYLTVNNYCNAKLDSLTSDQINNLMDCVRFSDQLKKADENKLVPKFLIIEAAMHKLWDAEGPKYYHLRPKPEVKRLQPRVSRGIRFEQNSSQRGIIYWLGTKFGKREWRNPAFMNIIRVQASSTECGKAWSVLDMHEPRDFWTMDIPSSWFAVDLMMWSVLPIAYTLRHGGNYVAESLRNWDFQGSVNGKEWFILRRHKSDESLVGPFMSATWTIKKQQGQKPFRFFRIVQTGHNSSGRNFLAISGFEVFGELWETSEVDPDSLRRLPDLDSLF